MECKLRKQHKYLILTLNIPHKHNYIWSAIELAINKYTLKWKCGFLGPWPLQLRSRVFGKWGYLNGGRYRTNEKKWCMTQQAINLGQCSLSKLNRWWRSIGSRRAVTNSRMMKVQQSLREMWDLRNCKTLEMALVSHRAVREIMRLLRERILRRGKTFLKKEKKELSYEKD